jgi:[ribosomal protein S18]-alanine N-acetyltransferase
LRREPPRAQVVPSSLSLGSRPSFRPITLADIVDVMAIERSAYTYPWSERFFRQEMQVECARSFLAEVDGRIAGYILFWLASDEVDIHNVAVHKDFRRRGLGRSLLEKVVLEARRRRSSRVTLEVRKSNLPAQKLYESMGFAVTGVRKGYYSDDGEDALLMVLQLT